MFCDDNKTKIETSHRKITEKCPNILKLNTFLSNPWAKEGVYLKEH